MQRNVFFFAGVALLIFSDLRLSAAGESVVAFSPMKGGKIFKIVSEKQKLLRQEANKAEAHMDGLDLSLKGVETTIAWVDLNNDQQRDLCASFASYSLYGNTGASITCWVNKGSDRFEEALSVVSAPDSLSIPGSRTNGFSDLVFGGPGVQAPKVWKWDGKQYK